VHTYITEQRIIFNICSKEQKCFTTVHAMVNRVNLLSKHVHTIEENDGVPDTCNDQKWYCCCVIVSHIVNSMLSQSTYCRLPWKKHVTVDSLLPTSTAYAETTQYNSYRMTW